MPAPVDRNIWGEGGGRGTKEEKYRERPAKWGGGARGTGGRGVGIVEIQS